MLHSLSVSQVALGHTWYWYELSKVGHGWGKNTLLIVGHDMGFEEPVIFEFRMEFWNIAYRLRHQHRNVVYECPIAITDLCVQLRRESAGSRPFCWCSKMNQTSKKSYENRFFCYVSPEETVSIVVRGYKMSKQRLCYA